VKMVAMLRFVEHAVAEVAEPSSPSEGGGAAVSGRAVELKPAMFLDRDGTIMVDTGYPKDPRQVQLLPGADTALAALQREGYLLVVVSNQSGIGRGLVTRRQAEGVHRRLVADLADSGVSLDAAYYCPHAPEEGCTCRKPSPRMLLLAARAVGADLGRSFMVGDKPSDVAAGAAAGCRTVLLRGGTNRRRADAGPDFVASDWDEVYRYIRGSQGAPA
jgi:D-glycero-D-manno-heptose 1,7-bisphosphate phosphatase